MNRTLENSAVPNFLRAEQRNINLENFLKCRIMRLYEKFLIVNYRSYASDYYNSPAKLTLDLLLGNDKTELNQEDAFIKKITEDVDGEAREYSGRPKYETWKHVRGSEKRWYQLYSFE